METVVQPVVQKATEAVSAAAHMATNQKVRDMERNTRRMTENTPLTNDHGVEQSNTDAWLSASSTTRQGPQLLEDNFAREKIHRFDHERIPERVVHARGAGAFGTFKLLENAADVTAAGVLTDTSRTTPVFVRFSTVLGSRGSADTVRDVRGFAVKFYTDEGNWDIVGNDIPVFFIQDAIKFPDVIHAGKPEPDKEMPQAQSAHSNFWDFQFLHTEATHMFMWAMSDRGTPRSYRMMQGFGVNTFTLINAKGERNFVKFHFTPTLGVHSLVWDEALKLAGQDPDFHRRDLYDAIGSGVFPKWKFGIQVCPEERQDDFEFDILDATKVWPEEIFPVRYIGELELNKNVDEYFAQTEQAAFCTAHIVPGIGFSDDPLLQGRNFSYFDTQLSRLGVNWQQLPINRPVCPIMNNNRDGHLQHFITPGRYNYWPNRAESNPPAEIYAPGVTYPEKVIGKKQRIVRDKFKEHFKQPQIFWNSMSPIEKAHIKNALCFELAKCDEKIVYERMVKRLTEISLDLAQAVAEKVGVATPDKPGRTIVSTKMKGLSMTEFTPEALGMSPTISTRMIAVLIADGFNLAEYEGFKAALSSAGALVFTIAPKRQAIMPDGSSSGVTPDQHFEANRSTMYDAVYIPSGPHAEILGQSGRAIHWIRESFGHCKTIGATGKAVGVLKKAIGIGQLLEKVKFATNDTEGVVDSYGVVTAAGAGKPDSFKEGLKMVKNATSFMEAFAWNVSQHRNFARELDGLIDQVAF